MRPRGLSLISFMVAASIFSLIFAFGLISFHQSSQVWRKTGSEKETSIALRRAASSIQRDLLTASGVQFDTQPGPETLTGFDGDAFWFLSALDSDGNFIRQADGTPFWQKNILYYTVTPDIDEVTPFGAGGADADGFEDHCPYKVLIRKEIDFGTPVDPTDETTVEVLIPSGDIGGYLTRPSSYSLDGLQTEPGVDSVKLVARDLLSTRCSRVDGWVNIRVIASANQHARKQAGFGRDALTGQAFLHEIDFTVMPRVDGN